jgi:hypothetical protein
MNTTKIFIRIFFFHIPSMYCCLLAFFLLLSSLSASAQQNNVCCENHLGFGLHYSYGNISPVANVGLQYSILYDHAINQRLHTEASLYFFGDHFLDDGAASIKRLSHGIVGNISLLYNFDNSATEQWRFGGGISMQQRFLMYALRPAIPNGQNVPFAYTHEYFLGAHGLLDHTISLDRKMDLLLRLQSQAFMLPIATNQASTIPPELIRDSPRVLYFISLGAFFRVGW